MTRATAPVAAEIIAGRPPTMEMTTAMVKEANRPIAGSTPAMIENEIASGISASATTRPASTSVRHTFGSVSQSGFRPRSYAAGDTAAAEAEAEAEAEEEGEGEGDKETGTCRARAYPFGGPGRAGGRGRPGRHPADGPVSTGPEVGEKRIERRRPAQGRCRGSHPAAKRHGGQAAASGLTGSRTVLSCSLLQESDLRRGQRRPRHGKGGQRHTVTHAVSNSTLTLE